MSLLHPKGYHALLVVDVVVHRHHARVELLVEFLLCKFVWCPLVPWKKALAKETFRSVKLRDLWAFCLKFMVSSATETYLSPLEGMVNDSNWLFLWGNLSNNSKEVFSCLVWGEVLLGGLWFLERAPLAVRRKVHWIYIYIYIYSFSNFPYPFSSLLVIGRILCLAIVPEGLSSSRCSRLFLAQIVSY